MNLQAGERRNLLIGVTCVTVIGIVLRYFGLSGQLLSGDDASVALSAANYVERGQLGPTMWNHPHLRDILVYGTLLVAPGTTLGIKFASFLLGCIAIPALCFLAWRLFHDVRITLLSGALLALDPVHIDYSRQAVQEVYMPCFTLLAILCVLCFVDTKKALPLLAGGLFFGLGIASKWYVLFPLLVTCGYCVYCTISDGSGRSGAIAAAMALLLLPAAVYLLTFLPWFQRGYDLEEWCRLQKTMYVESTTHQGYTPYELELDHEPYLWFVKPVVHADLTAEGGEPDILLAVSNPFVWLLVIPATVWLAWRGLRRRKRDYLFVAALFWVTYLPFLISARPIWTHTAFSVLPFAILAVAFSVVDVAGWKQGRFRLVFPVYLALVVVSSLPLYLLATGKGLSTPLLRPIVELYRPSHEK